MSTLTIERNVQANDGVVEISEVDYCDGAFELTMNGSRYRVTPGFADTLLVAKEDSEPYVVQCRPGLLRGWLCSCPDFKYRCSKVDASKRPVCKHILAAYHAPGLVETV